MFKEENLTAFLAEHVWKHMTLKEGMIAAKNCFNYPCYGKYIKIAVPDKNLKNELYQNVVQVEGTEILITNIGMKMTEKSDVFSVLIHEIFA